MTTKLTLSVNSRIVSKAKKYAKKNGISVSKIFEDHISSITKKDKSDSDDPLESLRKLKGIAKNVPSNVNDRDLIAEMLIEKHLK